jgi:hypothetical protein
MAERLVATSRARTKEGLDQKVAIVGAVDQDRRSIGE